MRRATVKSCQGSRIRALSLSWALAGLGLLGACAFVAGCGDDPLVFPEDEGSDTVADDSCKGKEDGEECDAGSLCLSGRCVEWRCGDGYQSGSEECDDGNELQDDGCDPTCHVETKCGNGKVELDEECDDGNLADEDRCSSLCQVIACRNNRVDPGEECDDGNEVDRGDGCTNACTTSVCGNGKIEKYESCDDGNVMDADECPANCVIAKCGNGEIEVGEVCDGPMVEKTGEWVGCADDCTKVLGDAEDECEKCQNEKCTSYMGYPGFDVISGCFREPNAEFGADPQPGFIQHCIDVMNCALSHGCGLEGDPVSCYCGSASIDECASTGPEADAPCVGEWLTAARTEMNGEAQVRFTDVVFPAGWAYLALKCLGDGSDCGSVCGSKFASGGEAE